MLNLIKKYTLIFSGVLSAAVFSVAHAQCPICTFAVIGGVGLARWLKIDDSVTGLWVGGLLVSTSLWTINWLKTKKWNFIFDQYLIPILYYAMVIIPLYHYGIMGHPLNTLWGIDKLLLGTIIGSIFFWAAVLRYAEIKKKNNGRTQFPFQRVVLPVGTLLVLSLIMFLVTRVK
jgi:hypothetical protein